MIPARPLSGHSSLLPLALALSALLLILQKKFIEYLINFLIYVMENYWELFFLNLQQEQD